MSHPTTQGHVRLSPVDIMGPHDVEDQEPSLDVWFWLLNVDDKCCRTEQPAAIYTRRPYKPEVWATDDGDSTICFARDFVVRWLEYIIDRGTPLGKTLIQHTRGLIEDFREKPWCPSRHGRHSRFFPRFHDDRLALFDTALIDVVRLIHKKLVETRYRHRLFRSWTKRSNLQGVLQNILTSICDQPLMVAGMGRQVFARGLRLCAVVSVYETLLGTEFYPREHGLTVGSFLWDAEDGESMSEEGEYVQYRCNDHITTGPARRANDRPPAWVAC